MTGKVTKVSKEKSYDGGYFWLICLKIMDDGKSARCFVYEKNGNFRRWMPFIVPFQQALASGKEVILDRLNWWRDPKRRTIDADSLFEVRKEPATA